MSNSWYPNVAVEVNTYSLSPSGHSVRKILTKVKSFCSRRSGTMRRSKCEYVGEFLLKGFCMQLWTYHFPTAQVWRCKRAELVAYIDLPGRTGLIASRPPPSVESNNWEWRAMLRSLMKYQIKIFYFRGKEKRLEDMFNFFYTGWFACYIWYTNQLVWVLEALPEV